MGQQDSERAGERRKLALMPAYILVLVATAVAAVVLARVALDAFAAAREAGAIAAQARQGLAFALIFNACAGAGLGLAAVFEILASAIRLVRGAGLGRVVVRLVAAMLPLLALGGGHALLNPEMLAMAGRARALLGG